MNSDTSNSIHNEADAARIPQLDAGGPAAAAFAEGHPTDIRHPAAASTGRPTARAMALLATLPHLGRSQRRMSLAPSLPKTLPAPRPPGPRQRA